MTRTDTPDALLTTCIQDLYAGERLVAERLPAVAAHATDGELRALVTQMAADAGERALMLERTGRSAGGPANLWMAGILDDSERDVRSTEPGALLDVAMIGAVRKAVAADRVSYETAVALAGGNLRAELAEARDGLVATDGRLSALLARIVEWVAGVTSV